VSRRRYFSDYGRAAQPERGPHVAPYLIIALLALLGLLFAHMGQPAAAINISGRVVDTYTGQPLAGAQVAVLEAGGPTNAVANAGAGVIITGTQGITIAGISTDTTKVAAPAPVMTTTSDASGIFRLDDLPTSNPTLLIAQPGYASQQVTAAGRSGLEIRLVPNTLHGTVSDPQGVPLAGATVTLGGQVTTTATDGSFTVSGGDPAQRALLVKMPGFSVLRMDVGQTSKQDVTLTPFAARAIYVNADTIASPTKFYNLIRLANETEINAMVIDVKADTTGYVLYKSALPQVLAAGAVNPIIGDLPSLVETLHKNHIYVIARQALFWDEKLAAAHPDWAIKSKSAGGPWQDAYGHHWVNPFNPEVWAYNIAIAKEVAAAGVDEIQFDYVRFPSDGNLADADYGLSQEQSRAKAISDFLTQAHHDLAPTGAFLAADVFGLSPIVQDDLGIGQQFEDLVSHLDYISPMAYPSHYADGFLGFDKPAEHPSEVVGYTLQSAQAKMLKTTARLRPWLQDFTLGGVVYEASRVRGQIETADRMGTAGWMLWNFDNVYTQDALKVAP
jgi:hypothetical protein